MEKGLASANLFSWYPFSCFNVNSTGITHKFSMMILNTNAHKFNTNFS
jgi:hypothetical protein